MFPEWHHAVPESAYFNAPETLKTFRMYPISRFGYVLHWLATGRVLFFDINGPGLGRFKLFVLVGYCL